MSSAGTGGAKDADTVFGVGSMGIGGGLHAGLSGSMKLGLAVRFVSCEDMGQPALCLPCFLVFASVLQVQTFAGSAAAGAVGGGMAGAGARVWGPRSKSSSVSTVGSVWSPKIGAMV